MNDGEVALRVADARVRSAVRAATILKDAGRRAGLAALRNADGLRTLAAEIKQHTLDHLDRYLEQFTDCIESAGGTVHVADTGDAARETIARIARENGSRCCVKAKSMTSEEIHLAAALERDGIEVVESDLGEWVVQIDHDRPSHIVTPIIHKTRHEVARSICTYLDVPFTDDPHALTMLAREHLRGVFRRCDLGISGVNFGVAETGTLCICTNEGNGRFVVTRPRVHVALMGIEKLVPRLADLAVFLKLLGRSATAQSSTVYTTLITGPRRRDEPDGPRQLHVVLMDRGRSDILAGECRETLRCIRCGACLNACPVYRAVGGHAYGSTYPGPIGALVSPLLGGIERYAELPQASSLCGACLDACPVRIDIPRLLVRMRSRENAEGITSARKRMLMRFVFRALRHSAWYRLGQWAMRFILPGGANDPWAWLGNELAAGRDVPRPAARSFRTLWREQLSAERSDGVLPPHLRTGSPANQRRATVDRALAAFQEARSHES